MRAIHIESRSKTKGIPPRPWLFLACKGDIRLCHDPDILPIRPFAFDHLQFSIKHSIQNGVLRETRPPVGMLQIVLNQAHRDVGGNRFRANLENHVQSHPVRADVMMIVCLLPNREFRDCKEVKANASVSQQQKTQPSAELQARTATVHSRDVFQIGQLHAVAFFTLLHPRTGALRTNRPLH